MVTVLNRGVPGQTTAEALARFETDVLAVPPAALVCFFGMNDALNSAKLVPCDAYARNLADMVRRARAGGARAVALVTPHVVLEAYVADRHPHHPALGSLNAYLAKYAAAVAEVARAEGALLADFRSALDDAGGVSDTPSSLIRCEANGGGRDGIHLTPAGYRLLAAVVGNVLRPAMRPDDTVVCFGDSLTNGVHVAGAGGVTGDTYPAELARILRIPASPS